MRVINDNGEEELMYIEKIAQKELPTTLCAGEVTQHPSVA